MTKVSVIIPVYNVELYLEECLNSVINQTLKDIEIICIDDCSTDNSYEILKKYAKKDNRIILLKNSENKGVGYTRNVGEKLAKGEYIYFIDPDDYISKEFIEYLYTTGKKYESDIVITNNVYDCTDEKISKSWFNIDIILNKKAKKEYYIEYTSECNLHNFNKLIPEHVNFTLWTKLYKKDFLISNNLFSTEIQNAAAYDAELNFRIWANNPKISYNNQSIYYYRIRDNSIVRKDDTNKIINTISNMNDVIKYYEDKRSDLIYDISPHIFSSCLFIFNLSSDINKEKTYSYLYNFIKKIYISKINTDENIYNEYILIKSSENYSKYILNKELFILTKKINEIDNKIKLFGIYEFSDRKIIYLFGIKITIKKLY